MEKKITSHISKGLIISLILIVVDLVAGFAHVRLETWFRWIPTLILCASIIWACISFGSQNEHNVTFGNLFVHGFKTSAVIACILFLYTLLAIFLIFPETRDMALDQARKQMEAKGNLSEDNIEQGLEIARKLFVPIAIASSILGTLIVGLIAALIGAAVTKKRPQTPFENQI